MVLSNRRRDARRAQYRLAHCVRTTMARDDLAYSCVYEREDAAGLRGVQLAKVSSAASLRCQSKRKTANQPTNHSPTTPEMKFADYIMHRCGCGHRARRAALSAPAPGAPSTKPAIPHTACLSPIHASAHPSIRPPYLSPSSKSGSLDRVTRERRERVKNNKRAATAALLGDGARAWRRGRARRPLCPRLRALCTQKKHSGAPAARAARPDHT